MSKAKSKVKATKAELRVMQSVYRGTDCCNEVYDYAKLHHRQEPIAEQLKACGLLTSLDGVVSVDGDGFTVTPERYGTGWRLTNAGYETLTASDPGGYPPDARRFYTASRGAKKREAKR